MTVLSPAAPTVPVRPPRRVAVLSVALVLAAAAVAAGTAFSPVLGGAAVGGLVLVAVARRDLVTALVLWVPTLFLEAVPALNAASKAGGVVLIVMWLLDLRDGDQGLATVVRRTPWLSGLLLLLLTWMTLSVLWAEQWQPAVSSLVRWYAVAAMFLLVATSVRDLRALRLLVASFVAGGVLAMLVSVQTGQPVSTGELERLEGGAGDPNFLGAWLLSGLLLSAGLLLVERTALRRTALAVALVLLSVGMAFTLSRGAFLTALVLAPVSLVLLRGRRLTVLGLLCLAGSVVLGWLASSEQAWERLSRAEGGSGRSDLWGIAWRMARDNPVTGVGMDGFAASADAYAREGGPIRTTYLVFRSDASEAHNVYLQLLAEGGLPALLLLLGFAVACVAATVQGARRWDEAGLRAAATLAYVVALAQISLLTAGLFLSSVVDKRLWLLLALGPAIAVASRGDRTAVRTAGPVRSPSEETV